MAVTTIAFVALHRHISIQYGCFALRGRGHFAHARANARSYEIRSMH
jgi:hypothetical protein